MTLCQLIKSSLILPRDKCTSKDELIAKLVELIYTTESELPSQSKDDVLRTINIREQIGGTTLPSGLSVPHARLRDYEGFILAFGIPAEPLVHENIQIRLMALMLTSQSGAPWFLPVLAELTKLSRDSGFITRLFEAENPEAFIEILKERDPELL